MSPFWPPFRGLPGSLEIWFDCFPLPTRFLIMQYAVPFTPRPVYTRWASQRNRITQLVWLDDIVMLHL